MREFCFIFYFIPPIHGPEVAVIYPRTCALVIVELAMVAAALAD